MRDCINRRVTPPKRVTSPTWGPPTPCKQESRSWAVLRTTEGGGGGRCSMGLEMRPIIQSPKKETKAMEPVFVFLQEVEVVFIFDSWSCQTRAQRESNYIEDQHWFHRGRLKPESCKEIRNQYIWRRLQELQHDFICCCLFYSFK